MSIHDGKESLQNDIPVNSYTEWHPLKEVIVGSIGNLIVETDDMSFRYFFWENLQSSSLLHRKMHRVPLSVIDQCRHDLDVLVSTLSRMGISVRRPEYLNTKAKRFSSPSGWRCYSTPPYNIRDQTLIYGNKIIETPVMVRSRMYENDYLKKLFYEYFERGAKWISAPRPSLLDNSFDTSGIDSNALHLFQDRSHVLPQYEMMLDAAQCIKIGKDIVVNVNNKNHKIGVQWLRSVLPDVCIHEINIVDSHIDATLLPLKPGVLLIDQRKIPNLNKLPQGLRKWKMIKITDEDLSENYKYANKSLASKALAINVLSIDEHHVIVNKEATSIIRKLELNGFIPVPVPFRHGRLFGGGFHCVTLDVYRDGVAESYGV